MKKIVLVMVAMVSACATFAKDTEKMTGVDDIYDMSMNIRRLGETLGLTLDQMETVRDLHDKFCIDMFEAGKADNTERKAMVEEAVERNKRYMAFVLNDKQNAKYDLLLDTTLCNRGLVK